MPRDYDLITSIEVLEHVTGSGSATAVANFCRHSKAILFSSTPEHFDEVSRINVRSPDHWAGLFALHGFFRDCDFDASFVASHAILFRSEQKIEGVVGGYERTLWNATRELQGVRTHRDHIYTELGSLQSAREELNTLLNTKTFRPTAWLRALWATVRGTRGR
ncbi:MAG: hypothetical protein ACRENX_02590 [Candidatus Dormibacteria bacterium]